MVRATRKLIIQIPCYNEGQTLGLTLADLPRVVPGVDIVEWLVIDDGSTDETVEVAHTHGVDHIVRHTSNRGLAQTFRTGIDACLRLGADVIVNTDGDNQYPGRDIHRLIEPIIRGDAEIVVGDRQTATVPHFTRTKKVLQAVGSGVVRWLSGTDVPDAVSGFRAFSRDAAEKINVVSRFSYTIETLIQAGRNRLAIASVPITPNGQTRQSRLFRSVPQFLARSGATMIRAFIMYQPLRVFLILSCLLMAIGCAPIVRFLFFYFSGNGGGHVQSLLLGSVLLLMGFVTLLFGIIADLIAVNRNLLERVNYRLHAVEGLISAPNSVLHSADLSDPPIVESQIESKLSAQPEA